MKNFPGKLRHVVAAAALLAAAGLAARAQTAPAPVPAPPRFMENLGRGVIALNQGGGKVFVSWRVLGTDPDTLAFNLYRKVGDADPVKVNAAPITGATNFVDQGVALESATSYFVRPVSAGVEQVPSKPWTLAAHAPVQDFLEVPLQTPRGYSPNDCSVGDLDGDGEYEIVVHMTGAARDNSQAGLTDPPIFQAYKLDGTLLWTINLGRNIREGAHYTQFMVYDLDGDGIAEIAMKTADGTTDGKGKVIGDASKVWVASNGYISDGPEFFTIFSGKTGEALATVPYIPGRGEGNAWGGIGGNGGNDNGNNRRERYLATIAYLDGERHSVVMCRGYYGRTVLAAWDWRDSKLTSRWVFDSAENANHGAPYISDSATVSREVGLNKVVDNTEGAWRGALPGCFLCWDSEGIKQYRKILAVNGKTITVDADLTPEAAKVAFVTNYSGMGAHWTCAADVDGDGRDEIVYHSMVVNHDGKGLFSTGLRHGDALHVGRFDPDYPGLQVFGIHENEGSIWDPWTPGAALYDAATGKVIWRFGDDADVGRGVCADIDPRHPGEEFWWSGSGGLHDCKGNVISRNAPAATNFAIWWDGDDLREILDSNRIMKWNWEQGQVTNLLVAQGCTSNNGSKSTPALSADILGDWREEVILRTTANNALRIYSTTIPTQRRLYTLMHDPQYRLAIASQNVGYNQPPHTSFYFGEGMKPPPRPNIRLVQSKAP
jgi:rhamnogalacturonan endolyase